MHQNKKILLYALVCSLALTFVQPAAALEDAIVAVVNDELITLKDLQEYVKNIYVQLVSQGIPDREIQKLMDDLQTNGLQRLIEDRIMLSKANAIKLEVNEALVSERLEKIKSRYPSEEAFQEALVTYRGSMSELRNKILDQLKIQMIIDREVKSKIYIKPHDVAGYYENHIKEYKKGDRVNLDSIYIVFKDSEDDARQKAQEALQRVRAGENFDAVAKDYSSGPPLGVVERGELIPEIENIVFNLNVDEISEPVEVATGLYIFKLKGKAPAQNASFEEVKKVITNKLYQDEFQRRMIEWLQKLKDDAYIEIKN